MERTRTAPTELTDRQREVMRLIARGHTNTEIAEQLGISLAGAKWHVSELLGKFNVETREELGERWEREHGIRAGLRRWATGLFMSFSSRAASTAIAGAAVIAASGITIVVLARQDAEPNESGAAVAHSSTPTAVAVETPAAPDQPWTEQDALAEADRFLLKHKLQNVVFDADPLPSLVLIRSELLEGITEYQTEEPDWYWASEDGRPRDVWHFKWRAEGLSGTAGDGTYRFEEATLETELWIEDGVTNAREPLADWTSLYASDGQRLGGSGSLRSHLGDRIMEDHETLIGEPIQVAWENGEPGGGWLAAQQSRGGWCLWRYNAGGVRIGVFGCGGTPGSALGMAVSQEGSFTPAGTVADLTVAVDVPPHIVTIELRSGDQTVERYATSSHPSVPGRFVYLSLGAVTDPVTLIAYDATGAEVDRYEAGPRPSTPRHQ